MNKPDWKKMQGAKRYPKEIRDAFRSRIHQLQVENVTIDKILVIMNAEGFKTPEGKKLKRHHITNQMAAMRRIQKAVTAKERAKGFLPAHDVYESPAVGRSPAPVAIKQPTVHPEPPSPTVHKEEAPTMVRLLLASDEEPAKVVAMIRGYYGL